LREEGGGSSHGAKVMEGVVNGVATSVGDVVVRIGEERGRKDMETRETLLGEEVLTVGGVKEVADNR